MRIINTQQRRCPQWNFFKPSQERFQRGVSLIELIVFMVVVSIAFAALMSVYVQSARNNVDPIIQVRLLEAAQSKLDEVMALKYAEETPTGGVPACTSCTEAIDGVNDVDDFNGAQDSPYSNYDRQVTVTTDGNRKLITVSVTAPGGQTIALSAYRYNF
jgi:MSHA pilin protein MshD